MRKISQKQVFLGILFLILLIFLWVNAGDSIMRMINDLLHGPDRDYSQYTVPLSLDTQKDLCEKFSIPPDDPLCSSSKVYAYDFYTIIATYFSNLPEEKRNLESVQALIGEYEYKQGTRSHNDEHYFDHWYDFTGNQKFPLVIQFEGDGKIRRIYTGVGRDSG